jgi:predicted enzyme involved in methoxymalonyl-ACP biosynthesis
MAEPLDLAWSDLLREAAACQDTTRFQALARKARRLETERGAPAGHVPVRVALLGGASTDLLERPLRLALQLVGLAPEVHVAPYNVWLQELLGTASGTARFAPQVAIILLTPHSIPMWPEAGATPERATDLARAVCRQLFDACEQLHHRCAAEIVVNTLPPFTQQALGISFAASTSCSVTWPRRSCT